MDKVRSADCLRFKIDTPVASSPNNLVDITFNYAHVLLLLQLCH